MAGESGDQQSPTREVGGYRLLHALGTGGMGTVYEAIDAEGRHVALKLLHPAFSADEAARERLRREVATLHRVKGVSVARVLDAEAESDEAFIVTELIDGQSLEESIHEHGQMDAEELAALAAGLAGALESIHRAGVLHRDLKPGNVMLTDDGPVVIDFGISQLADDPRITQTGLVTGTPGYVDPQVMHGANPTIAGDWWGWAAVLVFAATGRQPFGRGPGVLMRVESGRVDTEGLSPRVAQVLRRALHPDPERRMTSEVVCTALADHAAGREVTTLLADDEEPATAATTAGAAEDALADAPAMLPPTYAPGVGPSASAPAEETSGPRTAYLPTSMQPGGAAPPESPPAPVSAPQHPVWGHPEGQWAGTPGGQWPEGQLPAWFRPPPARGWISLAWLLAVVSLGLVYPSWVLLTLVVLVALLGGIGSAAHALRERRISRGPGRWDRTRVAASFPGHLLLGILLTLPGLIVGFAGGAIVWILAVDTVPVAAVLPITVAVVTLLLWWTPSTGRAREGERVVLQHIAPPGLGGVLWGLIAVAVALGGLMIAFLGGAAPQWSPFPAPPTSFF
ncbi:MAG TPA: serine/threonine protein kinase [Candidatus Ruania gallistercoris]|uniref:Serine/threonine protein kinase n=1 Tax=Candidatus Ruania gallistercoris TaxID=2838746 RepID=A0A9D2EBG2_9MICO|nr:serine/threonine protein kinase [Candidatus Ruania gallistercoris]